MRVSDKVIFNGSRESIQESKTNLEKTHKQLASFKKNELPSDNPFEHLVIVGAKTERAKIGQFQSSNVLAKNYLLQTETSLGSVNDLLARARELSIQASSMTMGPDQREMIAKEIETIRDGIYSLSNSKFGNRYIFSGFKVNSPAFEPNGKYMGDFGEIKVEIANSTFIPMNISGDRVFFIKDKDIRPSEEDLQKIRELRQTRLSTGESNLDRANEIYSMPNRELASKVEERVDFDQEKIQELIDTNKFPQENEMKSVFDVLDKFVISLQANDVDGARNSMYDLDVFIDRINEARSKVGARLSILEAQKNTVSQNLVDVSDTVGKYEDLDIEEAASQLKRNEALLHASMQTAARAMKPNLLDFLS